jgi:hypothetical protein
MVGAQRAGVFVVRAWLDEELFRARISYSRDSPSDAQPDVHLVTADPAEVYHCLAAWLRAVAAVEPAPDGPDNP